MSMQDILNFFLDPIYWKIIYVTLLVFGAMFVLWWAYMKLSKKNLFTLEKPKDHKINFWSRLFYYFKYIFIFPLLTFFWFLLFVVCLKVLTYKTEIADIMFLGIVIVSAVRIAAYVDEKMAEDLAKMLPLTLLAAVILTPSFISINIKIEDFYIFKDNFLGFAKYLLFTIVLEGVLKIINWAVNHKKKTAAE